MRRPLATAAVALGVVLALEPRAHAEPTPQEKATAESLFREARAAMSSGRIAEACGKFDASHKLDPQLGTLLNLAVCHEKEGRTASAWAEFTEVAERADHAKDAERAAFARKHARDLEPKIPRLRVKVEETGADLVVKVAGRALTATELSTAIPVDPGDVTVEASAPRKIAFTKTVTLPAALGATELVVPPLEDQPAGAEPSPPAPVATSPSAPVAAPPRAGGSSTLRTVSYVLMGVGVVGVGVGAYFGLETLSTKSDADKECPLPGQCTQRGLDLDDDARTSALYSTIGFAAGGAALATGVVLLLTSRPSRAAVAVSPTYAERGGGATLRVRFP